jgi:hypothetical protein
MSKGKRMKKIVKFYDNSGMDEYTLAGILSFDGQSFNWDKEPDEYTKELILSPISFNGEELSMKTNPDKFMETLSARFGRGSTFVASDVLYADENGDEFKKMKKADDSIVQKALSVGGFSNQDCAAQGETGNQNTRPIKVDGVKEQASKTPVMSNNESYYEKSLLKSSVNEWFYDIDDGEDKVDSLVSLKKSLSNKNIDVHFKSMAVIILKSKDLFSMKKDLDSWIEKT